MGKAKKAAISKKVNDKKEPVCLDPPNRSNGSKTESTVDTFDDSSSQSDSASFSSTSMDTSSSSIINSNKPGVSKVHSKKNEPKTSNSIAQSVKINSASSGDSSYETDENVDESSSESSKPSSLELKSQSSSDSSDQSSDSESSSNVRISNSKASKPSKPSKSSPSDSDSSSGSNPSLSDSESLSGPESSLSDSESSPGSKSSLSDSESSSGSKSSLSGPKSPSGSESSTSSVSGSESSSGSKSSSLKSNHSLSDDDSKSSSNSEAKSNLANIRAVKSQPLDSSDVQSKKRKLSGNDIQDTKNKRDLATDKKKFSLEYNSDNRMEEESIDPNCVFIRNLPWSIQDADICELFSECGEIKSIQWNHRKDNNRFSGTGFVTFYNTESASKALELNGKMIGQSGNERPIGIELKRDSRRNSAGGFGQPVSVKNNRPLTPKPEGCTTIYVGNLSRDVNEENITEFFKNCGEIKDIRWVNKNGQFKYCGFIDFKTTDAVDKAVSLTNKSFLGREMRIDYATDERKSNNNSNYKNNNNYRSSPFNDKKPNRNKNFRD